MSKKFFGAVLLLFVFLAGCGKEEAQSPSVVWEKGQSIQNRELLEEFLTGEEGAELTIRYADLPEESAEYTLRYKDGQYEIDTGNGAEYYPFFLKIDSVDAGSPRTLYVLSEQEDLSYRKLYYNMWLEPDQRGFRMKVLLWEGEMAGENRSNMDLVPEQYRWEAEVLLGLDSQPVVWGMTEEQTEAYDVFMIDCRFYECKNGMEYWEQFQKDRKAGKSTRLCIVKQNEGYRKETVIRQILYSGEYYDLAGTGIERWLHDYKYIVEYNEVKRYPTTTYYLSETEDPDEFRGSLNPVYQGADSGILYIMPERVFELHN